MTSKKNVDALTLRLRALIDVKAPVKARFIWLKNQTGISSPTWTAWWNRYSTASASMISSVSLIWPEHAFWLATGVQDFEFGHIAPTGHGFPQRAHLNNNETNKVYFKKLIEAWNWLDENNEVFENTIEPLFNDGLIPSITDDIANRKIAKANFLRSIEAAFSVRKIEIFLAVYVKELAQNELETRLPSLIRELDLAEKEAKNEGLKIAVEPIRQKINELIQWQKKFAEWTDFKNNVGLS